MYAQKDTGFAGIESFQLSDDLIRTKNMIFEPATIKAGATTPLVLVPNADTMKVLVFHEALMGVYGGGTNYATAYNSIVKYRTAGGGATVSTTVADFLTAGATGKMSTLKGISTDYTPEAGQDLVLTFSANPTLGDRKLVVKIFYSVVSAEAFDLSVSHL